jgi:glutamate-5-semialdehyde dehydrogenase
MLREKIYEMGKRARAASTILANTPTHRKNQALRAMAQALTDNMQEILQANSLDIENGKASGLPSPMLERLLLNEERIQDMAKGLVKTASLPDPVGEVPGAWKNEKDLEISRIRVPLGVIGIVYESRPNVTADAAGLCLKAGNAVILKGGKEAINSNRAIASVIGKGAESAGIPEGAIQLIDSTDRESTTILMKMNDYLDVLIPRGGKGLKKAIQENATVPVIMTGMGVCHVFIDSSADLSMAVDIAVNAKVSRPSTCNSAETLLIHKDCAERLLPAIAKELKNNGVELRGDERSRSIFPDMQEATELDWSTEYLDLIMSIKVVEDLDEAVTHINTYGTGHSEAIVTDNYRSSQRFLQEVDAAAVYVNASTRFTDGGEFGFGAEMGISTQKLHARGPMGLEQLTSIKYTIRGNGQIR